MTGITKLTRGAPYNYLKHEYRQKNNYSCGYYCVKALVNTLGNGKDLGLVKLLNLTTEGVSQNKIVTALRSKDVTVCIYRDLNLKSIKKFISQGKYIIAYLHGEEHWLLITGVFGTTLEFYDSCDAWCIRDYSRVKEELKEFGIVCGRKNKLKRI